MLLDSLQHDCGHLLQATSHILSIALIVTDIICVSEADPPSSDHLRVLSDKLQQPPPPGWGEGGGGGMLCGALSLLFFSPER